MTESALPRPFRAKGIELSEAETCEKLMAGFRTVSSILDETYSTLAADPLLADLAKLVSRDPQSSGVKLAILQVLDSRELSASAEVLQYFAHRFRWSWLQSEVESRRLESSTRRDQKAARHYERVLEAFADEWEDRDLFPSLDL
ncbi:hypothetical protein AB0D83_35920 [Streptomyces decoyicus]|uniref:hypothetical protein n=1 Tax=Streptomyces decoyicus TaxID=249567 RepID=UPI0033FA4949